MRKGGTYPASGRKEGAKRPGKGESDWKTGWKLRGWRGGEEASVCTGEGTLQPLPDSWPRGGELRALCLSLSPAPGSAGRGAPNASLLYFLL